MSNILRSGPIWDPDIGAILGDGTDSIEAFAGRAGRSQPGGPPIVWECDATSFKFSYVSDAAEVLLGFPCKRWMEPMFWAERIVHRADKDDAVNYCMLATHKLRDHMFEYRARTEDGRVVWLRDYVKVIRDQNGRIVVKTDV